MYQAFSHFLLRTPLFSFYKYKNVCSGNTNFLEILNDNLFQEAIYIASPTLHKELLKYIEGKLSDQKEQERLLSSLERYFSRMSTRCTPFGLFAACSLGEMGSLTKIQLEKTIQKTTRLDMYYLCKLSQFFSEIPEIRQKIKYFPNTSLYPTGKKYRYVEYKYVDERRIDRISSVYRSSYLNVILKKAHKGATIDELRDAIQGDEVSEEEVLEFIDDVIDSQVIVGELSPFVTGDDMLTKMIRVLDSLSIRSSVLSAVKEIHSLLEKLDSGDGEPLELYRNIIEKVDLLKIPYKENHLFQVDTIKEGKENILGHNIVEELQSAMQFLNRITPYRENQALVKFRQSFYNRYEEREVPLMEALDPEMGIGYPPESNIGDFAPLLKRFVLPRKREHVGHRLSVSGFQSILLKKTVDALSQQKNEVVLDDEDIKGFSQTSWNNLPLTMSCMFELLRNDFDGVMLKLGAFSGSCGANLLARFSHVDDEICEFVKEIVSKEQELSPNVVLAEIAHLPESRVGNILSRPHIRDYELLYLSNSDLPQKQLIHISDLMLSVRYGKLFLRSRRLNKEILPRLTTAHNYQNNPTPLYHFLCDLQTQNIRSGLYFTWGTLENTFPFLPRVRYKNTIFSSAFWRIKIPDIKHLFNIEENDKLVLEAKKWRINISLPRYVLLQDGDNELFVDWENVQSIKALFSVIRKRETIALVEFLYDPECSVVRDDTGKPYLNECIVAFYKNQKK